MTTHEVMVVKIARCLAGKTVLGLTEAEKHIYQLLKDADYIGVDTRTMTLVAIAK